MIKKRQQISTKLVTIFLFFLITIATIIVFTNRASHSVETDRVVQIPIYQENSYMTSSKTDSNGTILVYNGNTISKTVRDKLDGLGEADATTTNNFLDWYLVVATKDLESENNEYIVTGIYTSETQNKYSNTNIQIPSLGIGILLYGTYKTKVIPNILYNYTKITISEGVQLVDPNYNSTQDPLLYNGTSYGTITFTTPINIPAEDIPQRISTVNTSEVITLNLYNYGDNINDNWLTNHYYPGFQNGAIFYDTNRRLKIYTANALTSESISSGYVVDSGRYVTNKTNFKGESAPGSVFGGITTVCKEIAANATPNSSSTTPEYNATHPPSINCLFSNAAGEDRINRPVFYTVKNKLYNGYPRTSKGNLSLQYLFTNNQYATKQNTNKNITGLFSYDRNTSTYEYDSMYNAAVFDSTSEEFFVYASPVTPYYGVYPFGNFLPFNNIESTTKVTNIVDMSYYINQATLIGQQSTFLEQSLKEELNRYRTTALTSMTRNFPNEIWKDVVRNTSSPTNNGDNNRINTIQYIEESGLRQIDFTQKKDYFFGLEMEFSFYQPTDGQITYANGDREDMTFFFAGDDDTLVYIDDRLFLDIGAIHRQTGGLINFKEGKVYYYATDSTNAYVKINNPYKIVDFADLVEDPSTLVNGTFEADKPHTLKFYYLERGSGSGYLKLNFNIPLKTKIALNINKKDENNAPVNGARIAVCLADDINCEHMISSGRTDAAGKIHFETDVLDESISKNTLYYAKELSAPDGYLLNPNKHYFYYSETESEEFSEADVRALYPNNFGGITHIQYFTDKDSEGTITIIDEKGKSNINIKKIDESTNQTLSGAEFSLYSNQNCNTSSLIAAQSINVNGVYTFENLLWNNTYYLKETRAPHLYELTNEVYTITIDNRGIITFKNSSNEDVTKEGINYVITNRKLTKTFEFTKVAAENHTISLPNAIFKLYKINDTCLSNSAVLNSIYDELLPTSIASCFELVMNGEGDDAEESFVSDEDGLVSLELLYNSTYRLIEEVPPDGRVKPGGQWNITVSATGNIGDPQGIEGTALPPAFARENGNLLLPNIEVFDIPSTGSFGTILYTAFGVALMGGAYIIVKRVRKKKKTGSKEKTKQDSKKDEKIKKEKTKEKESKNEKEKVKKS